VLGFVVRPLARRSARRSRSAFFGERSRCAVSMRLRSSAAATNATSSAPRRLMITASRVVATASRAYRGPGRFFGVKMKSSSRCRTRYASRTAQLPAFPEAAPW